MTASEAERCSARSLRLDEPLIGTASRAWNWVMLEQPGPWGFDALGEARLPGGLGRRLRRLARRLGLRIVLIRRHAGAPSGGRVRCFFAHTGWEGPWLEGVELDEPRGLLDLDLARLARGMPSGAGRLEREPLFLVCTHGRHDPCCAERGRPLAAAMDGAFGDRSWECSHIGGDRFAGNLLCFPHGLYFGRVEPVLGPEIATAYVDGRIGDLARYRGRSCYPFSVQAAEIFLRSRHGLERVDDLRLVRSARTGGDVTDAWFVGPGGAAYTIRVRIRQAEPRVLTCRQVEEIRPPVFEVIDSGT